MRTDIPLDPVRPLAATALAIALFVGMDAAMKDAVLAIGVYNAMFWRCLVGVAAAGAIWGATRPVWPRREVLRVHLIRGAVGTAMALTWFWGIARLPLAEAIALSFIAPLIALFLAAATLGEKIGPAAIGGSLLGFGGVIVIMSARARLPTSAEGMAGAAAILVSAVLYAFNIVLMRAQAQVARPAEVAFFQYAVVLALLALAAPVLAVPPPAAVWPGLGLGLAAGLALASGLLLAWAYARAEAQRLAPVEYSALIWGALWGWLIFDEAVGPATIVGGVLIVAGCWIAARPSAIPQSPAEAAA